MRRELRRYRSAILLILAFTLGLGAQMLQAQVSVSPGRYRFGATIAPTVNDGAALGTTALGFSDLHLATGAVINWANGETIITGAADSLTLEGGQFITPAGTSALPAVAIGEADTGLYRSAVAQLDVTLGTARTATFSASAVDLYLSNINLGAGGDLRLYREAADIFQQGQDSATPLAQIYKGPDAPAGSAVDTAGGDITFAAGRSTGTGAPGNIYFSTGATNAPGTAAGPLTRRLQIASTGQTIIASHTRFNVASSTTGTNTPVLGANGPIGQTGTYVWISAIASDGTAIWIPAWR